jgi:hypothetical protein
MNHSGITELARSGRVVVRFCRIVASPGRTRRSTDSFTDTRKTYRRKLLEIHQLELEPAAGIEPATFALRKHCSTAELRWRQRLKTMPARRQNVKVERRRSAFDALFRFAQTVREVRQQLFFARDHVAQFVNARFGPGIVNAPDELLVADDHQHGTLLRDVRD